MDIASSTFRGCKAQYGGGIEVFGTPQSSIRDSLVEGCSASQGGGFTVYGLQGGGVASDGEQFVVSQQLGTVTSHLDVTNCTFRCAPPAQAVGLSPGVRLYVISGSETWATCAWPSTATLT